MKKLFLLATLIFAMIIAGCSENDGTQTSSNIAGFDGNNPALSINVEYTGKTNVKFSVSRFGIDLDDTYQYQWNFGDNASGDNVASSAVVEHNFTKENESYNVSVVVSDGAGESIGKVTKSVLISTNGVVQNAEDVKITDTDNPLTKVLFSGAISSDGIPLVYEWDFGDGTKITGPNNIIHTFDKFGKTYTVTVTATNKASEKTGKATKTVTTPKVDFYIQCTQNDNTVSCTPNVVGVTGGLKDVVYKWSFESDKENVTTVGNEAAVYTYTNGGEKTITVTGTSSQIEGTLEATTNISIATGVSLDPIECLPTNNLLEYTCSVNAMYDNSTGNISYKWTFNNVTIDNQTGNTATYKFDKFPPKSAPSYAVNVVATAGDKSASQSTKIEILHPTVTVNKSIDSVNNQVNLLASLSTVIEGASYNWTIISPSGAQEKPAGESVVVDLKEEGIYTASVQVSHETFMEPVVSDTIELNNSSVVKDLTIICPKVNDMHYMCLTNATAYQTVNGEQQQIPLAYQWSIAGSDSEKIYDTRIISHKFNKYNSTYRVNLVVIPQGGDVSRAYTAPQIEIKTSNPTVSISKPNSTIRVGETVTFTAKISNLVDDIQLENPIYTWYVGGVKQTVGASATFSYTFNKASSTDIRVEVTSINSLVGAISAQTSVTVGQNVLLPSDIKNLNVSCQDTNKEKNDIKKKCTVSFNNGTSHDAKIYLVPRGVDGQQNGTPIVFNNNETKDVIFDWPALNIDTITNRNQAKTFQAKLSVQLYSNGSKVGDLDEKTFKIQYPLASYEMYIGYEDFVYTIGTGATFKFKQLNTNLTNVTKEWYMRFNGKSGSISKTFNVTKNDEYIKFDNEMRQTRFAGSVKGNPYAGENGFAVKLSGGELSKPLVVYGVNTKQGISEDSRNAVGASLGNRGWIAPQAEMQFVSNQHRNQTSGAISVPFQIVLKDTSYNTTGWDQFCVIGIYGYDKGGKLWSLPRAFIMSQNTSNVNKDYNNEYYDVIGYDWTHEKGYIEQRTTYAQNGQPAVPGGYNMHPIGTVVEPKYYGFTGLHVGYIVNSGNLQSCVFAKKYDNNNKDKGEVAKPFR